MDQIENATAATPAAPVTVLTNGQDILTKRFTMAGDKVVKQSGAQLVRGTFAVHEVATLPELDALLSGLKPNQATTYGRPTGNDGAIVAKSVPNPPPAAINRTHQHFAFRSGPGILMLDYDPPKDGEAMSAAELIAMLHKAMPELEGVGMLWRPSSSSGIAGAGVRGQRIYIMVSDATQIPTIGKNLIERLWLAGFGDYKISESGRLLERTPIDAGVWQPERIDFAANPVVEAGISRTHYDSMIIDGCIFEVNEVPALTAPEQAQLKEIKQTAREAVQPQVQQVKEVFVTKQKTEMPERMKAHGIEADEDSIGMMVERATMQNVLMGNWPLKTADGQNVTVGQILDNPKKYHQARFADPLEPDDDLRVAYANLQSGGRPYLYTHKHHGLRFALERAPAVIFSSEVELPRMVDSIAAIFKKGGELYTHTDAMVYIDGEGKIVPAKPQWLNVQIQRICRFEAMNAKKEVVAVRCPSTVIHGLLANAANLSMDKLTAVRNAPTIDHDGRQIFKPGYDQKTGLMLINDAGGPWDPIPKAPTHAELLAAFNALWMPFEKFPYASMADKSVTLAAVLTSSVRACLRTCPGFGFSATAPGTGKTLLAQCIGALYDGKAPAVSPLCPNEEEWAKTLLAAVRGGTGALLYDNAEQPISSATLCAVTTAPAFKSRVLGETLQSEAEHRMLVLATGNGLQFVGDLNRRFFVCRLDANMEASQVVAREFALEPLSYCVDNRLKLINYALTLIQGYLQAGSPRVCDGLASMDDWNKLVRSTIVWLMKQGILDGFVDPKEALMRDSASDPEANMLTGALETAKTIFGVGYCFTVAQLVERGGASANDLFMDITGDRDKVSTKKLGHWLRQKQGRIMNGLRFNRGPDNREKTATWEVRVA